MESIPGFSLDLEPTEVPSVKETASSSKTNKATRIQKLKENLNEYKVMDKYLSKRMKI